MNAWQKNAEALAHWAMGRLVNRVDVWGHYSRDGAAVTAPAIQKRGTTTLTVETLRTHFAGETTIGLHSTSGGDTCKWIGFDIDAHDDSKDVSAVNWDFAQRVSSCLAARGFHHLIEDSNGKGGLHLWVPFSSTVPSPDAHAFARSIVGESGAGECETFPKQARASDTAKGYGNYLRIPGKHHKRDHWSRLWNGAAWLEDADAVDLLLKLPLNPPFLVPSAPAEQVDAAPPSIEYEGGISELADLVRGLPNTLDYDNWIGVGFAIKEIGGDAAFELFDRWSASNQKYDAKTTRAKWNSLAVVRRADRNPWEMLMNLLIKANESTLVGQWEHRAVFPRINGHSDTTTTARPRVEPMDDGAVSILDEPTAQPAPPVVSVAVVDKKPEPRELVKSPDTFDPFPLEILPTPFQEFCVQGAAAKSAPLEYVVLPLLTSCAAAIGMSRKIVLTDEWSEPAILWTCIIGSSGTVKTPCIRLASKTNAKISEAAHSDYQNKREAYEEELDRWESQYKGKKRDSTTPEKPCEPVERQYVCDDTTIEALAPVLKNNPRGLYLVNDELSGWFKSFGAYKQGRGADREHWLKIFSSSPFHINRKGGDVKHLYVPATAVSIAGATQPSILRELLTPDMFESGMIARFLICLPPETPNQFSRSKISQSAKDSVEAVIKSLYSLSLGEDASGGVYSKPVTLTDEATDVWADFHNAMGKEALDMNDKVKAVWSKGPTYGARLCLVLHLLRAALGETDQNTVDAETVICAASLTRWFLNESKRVYGLFEESPATQAARRAAGIIERHGGQMTTNELRRFCNHKTKDETTQIVGAMTALGWVICEYEKTTPVGGRPGQLVILTEAYHAARRTTKPPF